MRITGTSTLSADRERVWRALNDPAVLVRTIPGCRRLEALGEDAYAMTVSAGVGSIKGVYDGQVRLSEQQEPGTFRMHAQGAGAPGTIGADVLVTLEESPSGGTSLRYDAEATVGGVIGGVGQRMLAGVSKRMASEFFANVDAALRAGDDGSVPAPVPAATDTAGGDVFTAPEEPTPATAGARTFSQGVLAGAAAALAGALVGAWISRRRD